MILGAAYDTSADMWSLACLGFELLTGDLLFDPRSGDNFSRDEDHIAQMIELLGPFPKKVATTGRYCKDFFNRKGQLKHIHQLKPWRLQAVLHEKYKMDARDAHEVADFLCSLLAINPAKRATAEHALMHPFLRI